MSKSQPTINERTPQWQSGLPENLSVKTSDVLGYDLDEDMNEEIQPKVKTVGNQSSLDYSQRKHEQQANPVENEKSDDFEHESHQQQRSSPSHFTGGEKSELEKKDDEAIAELIHRPKENKVKTHDLKDDATSLPRKPVNDNKPFDENKDSKEKGHSNLLNEKPKSDPSVERKEHSEKMNDRSAVESDRKKESDSDDSENNFGQQKEYSDESKTKNADINRNPPDDTDQNKGFKEHKSKTSAHNKKEDGKDNQTLAGRVGNTGVDVEASKANKKDVSFESKKNYTNRKASSPSPKEDTRNDDNSEKTQAAAMQSGHQPKTQQKNDFSSSSDDSDREIDSSNQKNDRKYPDKTKSKSNENYQGLAENTGDTDGDLDPSKDSKNDNYKANDYDDANENSTSKNPKSANAGQQQEDNRNHPDTAHKTQHDVKNKGDKEVQPKSHRSDSAKKIENPENETLADRVRDFGVDVDASKANTFGPKDLGFLKDDKTEEDPNIKAKKSGDSKNQKNESSIQDNNESGGKNEDQNSIKQWIENLVTNDKLKSDDINNDLIDEKKSREVQDKSLAENKKSDSSMT